MITDHLVPPQCCRHVGGRSAQTPRQGKPFKFPDDDGVSVAELLEQFRQLGPLAMRPDTFSSNMLWHPTYSADLNVKSRVLCDMSKQRGDRLSGRIWYYMWEDMFLISFWCYTENQCLI